MAENKKKKMLKISSLHRSVRQNPFWPPLLRVAQSWTFGLWPRVAVMGRWVADILFPRGCLVCDGGIADGLSLCAACWGDIKWADGPHCTQCGGQVPYDLGASYRCPACSVRPPVYDHFFSPTYYDGVSRYLILRLKYGDRPEAADLIGRWLVRATAPYFSAISQQARDQNYIIVPVPLHRWRRWRRRYNQSALLAVHFAYQMNMVCRLDVLIRTRQTRPQVGLSFAARQRNVGGAFRLTKAGQAAIFNRSVILVDDVKTTGATLSACSKICKAGGAQQVIIVSAAQVRGMNV